MMIGSEMARPTTSKAKLPRAIPARAMTLSRPRMMSAVSTILTTADRLVAVATASSRAALHQEFDRDVDEREAPDQLDVRVGQQRRDDDREDEEQQCRGAGANRDAPRPSCRRQSTAGQSDDHGGVAGEHDVDQSDLRYADPEPGPAETAENRRKGNAPKRRIEVLCKETQLASRPRPLPAHSAIAGVAPRGRARRRGRYAQAR